MKPRKAPFERKTRLVAKTELQRRSELKRAPFRRGSAGAVISGGSTPPRNGPTKARSESSEIPRPIRLAVYARDEWRCMRCGIYIPGSGLRWGLQHRDARGMGGSKIRHTLPNLVLLCGFTVDAGTCTQRVELLKRTEAYAEGWLVPDGVTPEEWPVRRWTGDGPRWMQPGVEWVVAEPHPRQIEMGSAA